MSLRFCKGGNTPRVECDENVSRSHTEQRFSKNTPTLRGMAVTPFVNRPERTPFGITLATIVSCSTAIAGIAALILFINFDQKSGAFKRTRSPVGRPLSVAMLVPMTQVGKSTPLITPLTDENRHEAEIIWIEKDVNDDASKQRLRSHRRLSSRPSSKVRPDERTTAPKQPMSDRDYLLTLYDNREAVDRAFVPALSLKGDGSLNRNSRSTRAITSAELGAIQRRNQSGLQHCYALALKRNPDLINIRADFEVAIGDTGVARSVAIKAVGDASMERCIASLVKRWVFPPVGAQTIAYEISFRAKPASGLH